MDVDIETTGCRGGKLVGMQPRFLGYDHVIKLVGTVTFIRTLLILAGIEQNPGPKDVFISRYQYLLIDIGTKVLRKVFDGTVGNNFMKYLKANPMCYNQIQFLIQKGIITDTQKAFLPPLDNNPSSANFDITLLACLLRNVCGLRYHKDPVWKNPSCTDVSVEADITRLKDYRNYLSHIKTVLISDTNLTTKWNELSVVLKRLNGTGGIKDLNILIDNAQHMDVDDVLKPRYDDAIKSWAEMDQSFDNDIENLKVDLVELKSGQSKLKDCHSELRDRQSELIVGQSELKLGLSELQNGQSELVNGQSDLRGGQSELKQGQTKLNYGQTVIKDHQTEIKVHQYELKFSMAELKHEQREIKDGINELKYQQEDQTKRIQTTCDAQHETKKRVEHIEQLLLEQHSVKSEQEAAIKNNLIKIYKKDCSTLEISPLCCADEVGLDLTTIYQPPSMFHIPYHREETERRPSSISSYRAIFGNGDQEFRNIYVTGDAGMGKTSFCKRMSLLWCKSQCGEQVIDHIMQKDIDYMKTFEFVFYVSLRDTDLEYVVDVIIEQLISTRYKHEEMVKVIEDVLQHNKSLIIMDALDEWNPKARVKTAYHVPKLFPSDKCVYLTTCRPYRIEDVRLSRNNIDRQLHITGIHGSSSLAYVREIVKHINRINGENKRPDTFMREIEQCGLEDQISVPIIASHLIMVWFDKELADWSVAQLYNNIVEMLFERSVRNHSEFPPPIASELSLPDSLSGFLYMKKYFIFLEKICLLSFRSLFKHDKCISGLVFTKEQLMGKPYCIAPETTNFLCRIGILSKNKIIGRFGKKEHTLSFLHRSFVEYFAALFVASFDADKEFVHIVKEWNTVTDVLQFRNFFLLLAGLSPENIKGLFENIYSTISDDLTVLRRNVVSHYDNDSFRNPYREQIASLQDTVINCFKEVGRDNHPSIELQLQDLVFDDNSDDTTLKHLLHLNQSLIKSIHSLNGKYFDEFDKIKNLQCLSIGKVLPVDYVKFVRCMLQNKSSLHHVCIKGDNADPLIPKLPVRCPHHLKSVFLSCVKIQNENSLHYLTSMSLSNVTIAGSKLPNLLKFLSDHTLMENITLYKVTCANPNRFVLDLSKHTKLVSVCLVHVDIVCDKVNKTSLRNIRLCPISESIARCYDVVFKCLNESRLEHLYISGNNMFDYDTIRSLISTIKTLEYVKLIRLGSMALPDDVLLQLHWNTPELAIRLYRVAVSITYLQSLVDSLVRNTKLIKVKLYKCKIKSIQGGTFSEMSEEGSMNYASKCILSTRVSITYAGSGWLHFETTVK